MTPPEKPTDVIPVASLIRYAVEDDDLLDEDGDTVPEPTPLLDCADGEHD